MLIGWPLRSVSPVSLARVGRPDVGPDTGTVTEAAGTAHRGDQNRGADVGEPGKGPGELARVDAAVTLLAGGGVPGPFCLDGPKQPGLGDYLSGQLVIRHRRVVTVELASDDAGIAACASQAKGHARQVRARHGLPGQARGAYPSASSTLAMVSFPPCEGCV